MLSSFQTEFRLKSFNELLVGNSISTIHQEVEQDPVVGDEEENSSEEDHVESKQESIVGVIIHSFFVIPFIIACFCVVVVAIFFLLTSENEDVYDHINKIKTGSRTVRWQSAFKLSDSRWQSAFELSKSLSKPNPIVFEDRFVAEMIGVFNSPITKADDKRVRSYLAIAMGQTGNPKFAPPLREALEQKNNQDNLVSIISALGSLKDSKAVSKIHSYVDHPQPEVRLATVITLGNIGQLDSIQYLQEALNDTEENVRWDAAIALAKMGDSSGQQVILHLLNREYLGTFPEVDPYEQNQIILVAIKAASYIKHPVLIEMIKKLSENDSNMKVRNAAMEALK